MKRGPCAPIRPLPVEVSAAKRRERSRRSPAAWRPALMGALLLAWAGDSTGTTPQATPAPQPGGGPVGQAVTEPDQVQAVDLTNVPFKGPSEAPIRALEYADFLCPSCQSLAGAFAHYLPRSGNRVAVYFKNYPLEKECNPTVVRTLHVGACNLALGAVCAHEQERFWPYHDKVFGSRLSSPALEDVVKLASEAGLDSGALQACLGSARAKERLAQEIAEAQRVGVTSTPTVLVNGKRLLHVSDFTATVEKESTRLGLQPASAPPAPR